MLNARNISFSYGNRPVLQNLSFSLEKGERLLLLGPSGQGKTTFLRLLCGLLKPQRGTIQRPSRLGVVFQEDRLLPTLTLEENLCLVSRTPALARQIGEELGLGEYFSHYPAALSGGQRRRGALGRALAFPCDALLMDEPFQGLDASGGNYGRPAEPKSDFHCFRYGNGNHCDAICVFTIGV